MSTREDDILDTIDTIMSFPRRPIAFTMSDAAMRLFAPNGYVPPTVCDVKLIVMSSQKEDVKAFFTTDELTAYLLS